MTLAMGQVGQWSLYNDSPFGVTIGFNNKTPPLHAQDVQLWQDLKDLGGISRVRVNALMEGFWPAATNGSGLGTPQWASLDAIVEAANQHGFRVTLIARGFAGSTQINGINGPSPCDAAAPVLHYMTKASIYQQIAVALAQRYSGDGNPNNAKASDGSGRRLQVDNIEIGNEEFDGYVEANGSTSSDSTCRNPLRYVNYVRQILPAMRAPVSQGGGGWIPRTSDNFPARVGMWGEWDQDHTHITHCINTWYNPATDATWNPSGDHTPIIGTQTVNGARVRMLDYINCHNYKNAPPSTEYDIAQELADIKGVQKSYGDTTTPVWVTEFGTNGPSGGASEASQSTYYQAVMPAIMNGNAQHCDLFTINYNIASTYKPYTGQPMAIACASSASSTGYVRFAAYTWLQGWMPAHLIWPFGFGAPPPAQGSITFTPPQTLSSTVNLTTDGSTGATQDWMHWGLSSAATVDHKASVTQQIQTFTSVGSGTATQDTSAAIGYTWTDGTPDTSATATTTGVKVSGVGNGFSFTVPVPDTASHTLTLYLGANLAQGKLRVSFNDGTTPDVVDTSVNATGGAVSVLYTVTYQALAAGTLTVTWTMNASNAAGSYVSLQAADIPGGTPVSSGGGSSLTGSVNLKPSASVNLTSDGGGTTADWAHWGYTGIQQDHKSGVASLISNITQINNGNAVLQQTTTQIAYGWSDGTPDASVGSTNTGVQMILASATGGPGTLTVSPAALNFSTVVSTSSPPPQTLVFSNTTGSSASWTSSISYGSGSGWLSLNSTLGTVPAGSSQSVSIGCVLGSLAVGTYTATLTVTWNGGASTQQVSITFSVNSSSGGGTPGILPGQVIYSNGVSNYLFGTNNPNYGGGTITTDTTTQTMVKNAGFTVMRLAISPGSSNSTVDTLIASATNSGCVPLIILIHNNPTWNQQLVTYLGNRCLLYEFANEPDLYGGGYNAAQYFTDWSNTVPACRTINPNAAFIGPVMGVFSNLQSWLTSWLTACAKSSTAGIFPDGISFHIYPCTGDASKSDCAGKAGNFASAATKTNAWIAQALAGTSHAGKVLPLCLTEWNIDANGPPQTYTQDQVFCNAWYPAALESMVGNYAMACQFDASSGAGGVISGVVTGALDMIDTSTHKGHPQWVPITTEIATLQGSSTGGPPTLTQVAQDSFHRTVANGWGASSDGTSGSWVSYTEPTANAPTLSVNTTSFGQFKANGVTNCIANVLLGSQVLADCDAVVRVTVSTTGDNAGPSLRSNAAGTVYYRCSLSGGILELTYLNNGVRTNLYQSAQLGYSAGTPYWIRFRTIGTTLYGRYWADGTTEPADFTNPAYAFTYTLASSDPTLTTGQFGLRARTASTSGVVTFDSFTVSSIGTVPQPPPGGAGKPHIAVVMMENRAYSEIKGNTSGWPHVNSLLNTYGYCSSFYSTTHPSLPNYIALTCGSTKGVTNDSYDPAANPIQGASVFDSLDAANIGWKVYAESLPSAGYLGGDTSNYFRKHDPVVYYGNFRGNSTSYQQTHLVPYGDSSVGLQADLNSGNAPPFLFIVPNEVDDGHGNPYQYPPTQGMDNAADTFASTLVSIIQASNWYTQNHGKILFVWDEGIDADTSGIGDANPGGGHTFVLCVSEASRGVTFSQSINHYGVLRTIEEAYGLPLLNKSSNSANGDMTSALGAYTAIQANALAGMALAASTTTYQPRALMAPLARTTTPAANSFANAITLSPFTSSSSNSSGGSNVGNGFAFTTLADTTPRTLNVYVDVNQGTGNFVAQLLDGSGIANYTDSSLSNPSGTSSACYTLTYQANAPSQQLQVSYTLQGSTASGTQMASDTFTRANAGGLGTASDGEQWATYTQTGIPTWSIVSNQCVYTGTANAASPAILGTQQGSDMEALAIVQVSNRADIAGLLLRSTPLGTTYYQASILNGAVRLVYRDKSGTDHLLTSANVTYSINAPYTLRFRVVGSTLSAKLWPADGTTEPSNWTVTATDTNLASGQYGLRGVVSTNSDSVTFDTYSVASLTASSSGGTSPTSYVSLHAASMPGTPIVSTAGSLSGSSSTPTGTIDLTVEGVNDWAAWSFSGASSFDHKSNVTQQIQTYTPVGSGTITQGTSGLLGFSWLDGTPDASATASTTESEVQGVGNGYSFTVPADTTPRTLYVYCGVNHATGTLTTTLSDGSASAYSDSSLTSSSGQAVIRYALTYNAANANQTLTVTWTMTVDNGGSGAPTTLASDTFARSNQSGWGTASDGTDTWSPTNGLATTSIVSNRGKVSGTTAGAGTIEVLGTGTQSDGESLVRFSLSSTGVAASLVQRLTAATTYYEAYVQTNTLYVARVVSNVRTNLAHVAVTATASTNYWLRFRLSGATLYARFWADGSSEPTTWTLTATDTGTTITGAGQYGIRGRIDTTATSVLFDSYTMTTLATGGTPGNVSLGAATLVGATSGSGGGGGGNPPPPPPTNSIAVNVDTTHPLMTPWLGLGVEMDAYDHGTGTPIGLTTTQRALIEQRLGNLNPQLIRTLAGSAAWWCPTGTVGTYTFNSSIMQEWMHVFDYCQSNGIPVLVGVIAPTPFTATNTNWCTAFVDLINYLINTAGYTCIEYVSGLSEPDTNGLTYSQYKTSIEPALVSALATNHLTNAVTLLGPDTTAANDTWLTSASTDLASSLQGYARHSFPSGKSDIGSDAQESTLTSLVSTITTHDANVLTPILQSEMAYNYLAPGVQVTGYQYGVEMADFAVQVARSGMASGVAWLLDDDMHNTQYGMWGIVSSPTMRPWYFPWQVLTNTLVASSTLYAPTQPASNDFRVVAAQSPSGGGWTFVLVNRNSAATNVTITVPTALTGTTTLAQYVYSSSTPLLVDGNGFPLPSGSVTGVLPRGITVALPGNAVMVLTQQTTIALTAYDVSKPPLPPRRQV